jgi:ubiquinone/menaquinone biosynthesis C-methylase UbiE
MGHHTFDPESAQKLEGPDRFRYLSREELVGGLAVDSDAVVADVGSGTGFYTREVAPYVGTLYGVDLQAAMHAAFRDRTVPPNVELVRAPAAALPFTADHLDGLFSTMTFHEISAAAPAEFARVVRPGGSLVVADWSANGDGAHGPPTSERHSLDTAIERFQAVGFAVEQARERPETFFLEATR